MQLIVTIPTPLPSTILCLAFFFWLIQHRTLHPSISLTFLGRLPYTQRSVLSLGNGGIGRFLLKTLLLLAWLPFQLFCGVWSILQIAPAEYMIKAGIIKDDAFYNSFRYGLYSLVFPLTVILWTLLGTFVFRCGFWLSLVGSVVLTYLAFPAFYRGLESYRVWISDLKLLFRNDLRDAYRSFKKLA